MFWSFDWEFKLPLDQCCCILSIEYPTHSIRTTAMTGTFLLSITQPHTKVVGGKKVRERKRDLNVKRGINLSLALSRCALFITFIKPHQVNVYNNPRGVTAKKIEMVYTDCKWFYFLQRWTTGFLHSNSSCYLTLIAIS